MSHSASGLRVLAKTAILWLTVILLFASAYGALLSSRPSGPTLTFSSAHHDPVPTVVADTVRVTYDASGE